MQNVARPQSTRAVVAWNTASQLTAKLATTGTTFIISILLAASVGAAGYGDFTKITTYVGLFYLLTDFGLNAIFLQKSRGVKPTSWSELLVLRFLGGIFCIALALILLTIIPKGESQGYTDFVRLGVLLFSPTILFQALLTTANALFQQKLRYDLSAVAVGIGSLCSLVIVWISLQKTTGLGTMPGLLALLVGSGLTGIGALFLAKHLIPPLPQKIRWSSVASMLRTSAPLGLTLLFNLVYFRSDSFILALSRPTIDVGIYGFAYKIFEAPLVLPTFFMNAVYPLLLQTTRARYERLTKTSFVILLIGGISLTLTLWIGAPLLSLIRPEFTESIAPLRVLSLGLPLFFLSSLTMWLLIAQKKQFLLALIYGTSMVVNVLLNSIVIPKVGYMGAAWITVGSEALVLGLSTFAIIKSYGR